MSIEIAAIPQIEELNIGHFLVSEAVFIGAKRGGCRNEAVDDGGQGRDWTHLEASAPISVDSRPHGILVAIF
jgi:hypothetical protein